MSTTALSIIVPAYREAGNLRPLTERVFAAVQAGATAAELIIVDDDSRDGSADVVGELSAEYPVRIVVRRGERGLGSAVLRGFAEAAHDIFVVLDADLQHPPERIPALVGALVDGDADFVIGSRYAGGGSIRESWPWRRRVNSAVATWLAKPLVGVRDPMSGFFALRRRTWEQAASLNPVGYKIALELMVKGRCRRCAEVPIDFDVRYAGQSKLRFAEQLRYLQHLARLYAFKLTDRPGRMT